MRPATPGVVCSEFKLSYDPSLNPESVQSVTSMREPTRERVALIGQTYDVDFWKSASISLTNARIKKFWSHLGSKLGF